MNKPYFKSVIAGSPGGTTKQSVEVQLASVRLLCHPYGVPRNDVQNYVRNSALILAQFVLVLVFFLHPSSVIHAQTISGVINTYAHVIAIDTCMNTATVPSTAGFSVGDSVLVIQMKGAIIDTTNSASYGTILSLNGAGQFEIAAILAMPDLVTIRFSNKLLNTYDTKDGAVQLVRIPQYTNVTVTDTLRPKAWDPNTGTGGVLALEATGILTLDAQLNASGLGFWGGGAANSAGGDSVADYIFDGFFGPLGGEGGYKGEGIASGVGLYYNPYNAAGRGAPANGGGGGNAHNAGGGGGGNGGNGGRGGDQTDAQGFGRFANGGGPGKSLLPQTQPRLFMGGGGGGGQQNDHLGTDGGNGGGIIIIRAPIVISAFDTIQADGLSPDGNSMSDGAGGGGAGGSVFIDVDSILITNHTEGAIWLRLQGGDGGSVDAQNGPFAFGPGGGGSGGFYSRSGTGYGVWFITGNGGKAGILTNCTNSVTNNSSYGAADGTFADEFDMPISESTVPYIYPAIVDHSFTICSGDTVSISASGANSYLWTPSEGLIDSTNSQITVSPETTMTYTVEMTTGTCFFTDTVHVKVITKPNAAIAGDTVTCNGNTLTYSAPNQPGMNYQWTVAGGTPASGYGISIDVTWNTTGTGTITLTASNGTCSAEDSAHVTVAAPIVPVINATNLILANAGDSSVLSLSGSYTSYFWSTGQTTSAINIDTSGVFRVTVTDTNGCTGMDSIEIFYPATLPSIELALSDIQAYPGDHIILPVSIVASQNLGAAEATGFYYTIHFDQSLLEPLNPDVTSTYSGGERFVTKHGTITNQLSTNLLDQIEFIAALGDTSVTAITFDTVIWTSAKPIATSLDAGNFTLLGVCPAGGNRFFDESGDVAINGVQPNPVAEIAIVTYSLAESGETTLYLVDMLGRRAITIASSNAAPGNYDAAFDASQLANGVYNLVMLTPSQVFTRRVEVCH